MTFILIVCVVKSVYYLSLLKISYSFFAGEIKEKIFSVFRVVCSNVLIFWHFILTDLDERHWKQFSFLFF